MLLGFVLKEGNEVYLFGRKMVDTFCNVCVEGGEKIWLKIITK